MIPVLVVKMVAVVEDDRVGKVGKRIGLERSGHPAADVRDQVGDVVHVPHGGSFRGQSLELFRNHVKMVAGLQRNLCADHGADFTSPDARAVDHDLAGDRPAIGFDTGDLIVLPGNPRHARVIADCGTIGLGALDEGLDEIAGINLAVGRGVGDGIDVVDHHPRHHIGRLGGRNHTNLEPHCGGRGRHTLEFDPTFGSGCYTERGGLAKAGGLTGFRLEPRVEIDRVDGNPAVGRMGANAAGCAAGMPGGAR